MNRDLLHISDFEIQAFVDGELEDEKRRKVMLSIMSSPENMARLEELLEQNRRLQEWWAQKKKN